MLLIAAWWRRPVTTMDGSVLLADLMVRYSSPLLVMNYQLSYERANMKVNGFSISSMASH